MKTTLVLLLSMTLYLANYTLAFGTTPEQYRANIQQLLDDYALRFNASFQMGVVHESFNMTLASGIKNHVTGEKMTTEDKIPEGSVAKSYTVMAILRLIDLGKMGFNDTIASHVDDILMKSNGTNLQGIWKGDAKINNVTIY